MMLSKKSFIVLALLVSLQAPSLVHAGKIKNAVIATYHGVGTRSKAVGKAIGHGVAWPFKKVYAGGRIGYRKTGELVSYVATGIASQCRKTLTGINRACENFHRVFQPPMTTEEIREIIQNLNRQSHTMIDFLRRLDTIVAQAPVELPAGTTAEQFVGNQLLDNQPLLLFFNHILTTMRSTPAFVARLSETTNNIAAFIELIKQQAQNYGITTLTELDEASANLHFGTLVNREMLAKTLPWLKRLVVGGIIIITASGIVYLLCAAAGYAAVGGYTLIPLQLITKIFGKLIMLPLSLSWSLMVGAWYLIVGNSALQEQAIATCNRCIAENIAQLPTIAPVGGSSFIMATPEAIANAISGCLRSCLG